jgi:hypothetical protein
MKATYMRTGMSQENVLKVVKSIPVFFVFFLLHKAKQAGCVVLPWLLHRRESSKWRSAAISPVGL